MRPSLSTDLASESLLSLFAAIGHALWCQQMISNGWSSGDRYDERARQHDAIGPFTKLSPVDQRSLLLLARDHAHQFIDAIDFPRGPDREFLAREMRVGLKVGWAPSVTTDEPGRDLESEVGTVIDWECNSPPDQETLRLIRVQWPGGIGEHFAVERGLRRLS
ncbi:MAG: RyR domain-containing protein [Phycisphaerales bacterium]